MNQSEPLFAPREPAGFCVRESAVRRVKNVLPRPEKCRYCAGPIELVNNATIYGRSYGVWPYAYLCQACDAYVGLHPHTDIPLGTLANRELREARKKNKRYFLALIDDGEFPDRKVAYAWLATQLKLPVEACHWGWFEQELCERAGAICKARLEA